MVPTLSLLLPVLLSAVLVFVVSSIIHMLLPYHRSDFGKLPAEEEIMDSLREFKIPPGDYVFPFAGSAKAMGSPEHIEKSTRGPVALMTVMPSGPPTMTGSLIQWLLYCVLVAFFVAYITGRALGPGAEYLAVFRFSGTAAFSAYALGLLQNSIWYKRKWSSTLKSVFDGFLYALVTAGVFGWLWPDA